MTCIGLIANPASGKDIRRLVAHASTFDNQEKVNIVRRVLLALDVLGVDEVLVMPDQFGIGQRAADRVQTRLRLTELQMLTLYDQGDSTRAAGLMAESGVACIITLGGDGTNRAVAKGAGDTPLLPISTGTNNVFPQMVEGTLAGLAAGLFARGAVAPDQALRRARRLEVWRGGEMVDLALVDVAVYDDLFVASRAVWDMRRVRAVAVTQVLPGVMGLSAIPGVWPAAVVAGPERGAWVELGETGTEVLAPVAPGQVTPVRVTGYQPLAVGDEVRLAGAPAVLALDGERELTLRPGEPTTLRLSGQGPLVLDVQATLHAAAVQGALVQGRLET